MSGDTVLKLSPETRKRCESCGERAEYRISYVGYDEETRRSYWEKHYLCDECYWAPQEDDSLYLWPYAHAREEG